LFGARKIEGVLAKDSDGGGSTLVPPRGHFATVVANLKTREDAIAWASEVGISLKQLGSSDWLYNRSKELGGGKSFAPLYYAIKRDKRWSGDFSKFKIWLGISSGITDNFGTIVASWTTPQSGL
jgi:hypothetical protein